MRILQAGPVVACSLVFALFAISCTSPGGGAPAGGGDAVQDGGEFLVFDRLALGQSGSFTAPVERVYRDEDSWKGAQDSLRFYQVPEPVDFSQSMVVLLAIPQESGGYSIEVQSVEKSATGIVVEYEVSVPASDCIPIVGTALSFQAVSVRRADGPVSFVRRDVPYRCTWRQ